MGVRVGVRVAVGVRVTVGVLVEVPVLVGVGVRVPVAVMEGVGVTVGVLVTVGVRVLVPLGPRVAVSVGEAVGVGEFCALLANAIISAGTSALVSFPSPFTSAVGQLLPLKMASTTAERSAVSTVPSQLASPGRASASTGDADRQAHTATNSIRNRAYGSWSRARRIPTPRDSLHASPRTDLQRQCTAEDRIALHMNFKGRNIFQPSADRSNQRPRAPHARRGFPLTAPALAAPASA